MAYDVTVSWGDAEITAVHGGNEAEGLWLRVELTQVPTDRWTEIFREIGSRGTSWPQPELDGPVIRMIVPTELDDSEQLRAFIDGVVSDTNREAAREQAMADEAVRATEDRRRALDQQAADLTEQLRRERPGALDQQAADLTEQLRRGGS